MDVKSGCNLLKCVVGAKKIPGSLSCSPIASPQTNFLDETLPDVMEGAFVPGQPVSENTSIVWMSSYAVSFH